MTLPLGQCRSFLCSKKRSGVRTVTSTNASSAKPSRLPGARRCKPSWTSSNSERFVHFLEDLSGIDDLFADESLEGGGLHQSPRGGFLNIHADFTVHPKHQDWRRRVNLLLYLNEDWKPAYGGDLELWSTDMKRSPRKVAPVGNRVVVFTTNADSYHGHPDPLTCPPDMARRSLALYYFTKEDRPLVRSTEYRARPGDGARAALIGLDKYVLRAYDWSKRHLGVSDQLIEPILRRAERFRRKGDKT